MLRDCPLCPLSGEFLSQIGAEFCQKLFCIYWNDHMAFILQFVEMVYCIDLQMLKNPCVPEVNPTWSCCMIFLMYCWTQLLVFCWGFLYPCSSVKYWPVIFFLWYLWFWYKGDGGLIKWIWEVFLPLQLLATVSEMLAVNSSLNVW